MIAPQSARPMSMPRYTSKDFDHSPLIVFYEVTQACDLVCQHCRACAQSKPDPSELSPDAALRLIDQLAEFPNPPMLVLTGGDPLKRPDIYAIIRRAAQVGLETAITPSATPLVTPEAVKKLREAGIARMAVSLDGVDASSHDAVRGVSGSYDRTIAIIKEARQQGMSVQVNTTLTPRNLDQVEAMAELLEDLEIVLWSVFFLIPVGRALEIDRLGADACEVAFAQLWRQSQRRKFAIKTTEAPHYRRFALQNRAEKKLDYSKMSARYQQRLPLGVNDGRGIMFVSHSGMIHPSGFMPIVCGVFPLSNVVQVYQQSGVFRSLRDVDLLDGKCGECEFRTLCGGSRARAYALTGNPLAPEPDCAYTPRAQSTDDSA